MNNKTRVVVIGGGIVGCAAAYYLAKQGVGVTLVEKGTIAGEQSSRNWGFVRQQGRDPAELPLMIECNRIWQGLEQELDTDLKWKQGGNLRVITDKAQLEPYRAWQKIAHEHGLDTQLLDAEETAALLPGLATPVLGALYTVNDGQADPHRVARAFAAAAGKLGAEVVENCAVLSLQVSAGAVRSVQTEQGELQCNSVICAAGAWSSRLLRPIGLRLPQLWLRASAGYTTPAREFTPCAVWMPGVGFRQGHDGGFNIAYGGKYSHDITLDSFRFLKDFRRCYAQYRKAIRVNLDHNLFKDMTGKLSDFKSNRTLDPPPNRALVDQALHSFKTSFPEFSTVEFDRTWAGYLDATPDMLPVIDRVDDPSGLVIATGFSGHGFGLGPISGLVASQLSVNEKPTHDLHAFRYSRFHDGSDIKPGNVI